MSSKRRVERELTDLSDELLGGLSVDERTDLFVAAASAGNEEWVASLQRTAPWKRYEMAEFEYVQRVGILSTLSMVANAQLAQCCQAVTLAESQREAAVMAVLVGGRRVAVDQLEISLAELLALTHVAEAGLGSVGTPVDEARCERVLGDVDVLMERCREFGGDEDLSREALNAEADAFANEVAERFTLSRNSGETAE